jgi:hypothetical protein
MTVPLTRRKRAPAEDGGVTAEQRSFAAERGASVGVSADRRGAVYIYREERFRTLRWMVDSRGRVVDLESLRYPVPCEPQRFLGRRPAGARAAAGQLPEWTHRLASDAGASP